MATYRALKRNLRRNITPYNEAEADIKGPASFVIAHLLAILLAFSVTFVSIPAATNLILRVPDLYSFDLSRTGVLKEAGLEVRVKGKDVAASTVGSLISGYMLHKTDDFQLTATFQGRKKPVFTVGDGAAIQKLRRELDSTLPAAPAGLAVFLIAFIYLFRAGRYTLLRRSYGAAWIIYLLSLCGLAFVLYYGDVGTQVWRDTLGIGLGRSDTLTSLFDNSFFLSAYIVVTVLSLVIMIIGGSVTFALTKNRYRLFT
jgi:hypothetical protein